MTFGGIRIIQDANALEETDERLFPESKHRSARIHKKLMKRHGGEFRKVPAAFRLPNGMIVCHPAVYAQMQKQVAVAQQPEFRAALEGFLR